MYLLDIERVTTGRGLVYLYAIGDTHLDLKTSNHERLAAMVAHVAKDPHAVAIFVGDLLDGRIPGRKHFDADAVRIDFLERLKSYVNHGLDVAERLFRPLIKAGVPLACVSGNHDDYLEEIGLTAELVRRLGGSARYLGGEGLIRLRTGKPRPGGGPGKDGAWYTTVIHASHGYGGGRRPGSKVSNLQSTFEWIDADVVVQGHVHDGDIRIIPSVGVPRTGALQLIQRPRIMYRAPGFVERSVAGCVTYAGKKGYGTNDMGLQYVRIDPMERRAIRHELDLAV